MKCPLCNTEMRIKNTEYVKNEGKLYYKQLYTCRNKKCPNFGKDVKTTYMPMTVSEDPEAVATE